VLELRVLAERHPHPRDAAREAPDLGEALLESLGERDLPRLGDGGEGRPGVTVSGAAPQVGREGLR